MNQTHNPSYTIRSPKENDPNYIVVKEQLECVEDISEFSANYGESLVEKSDPLQVEAEEYKIKVDEVKFLLHNSKYENAAFEYNRAQKDDMLEQNNKVIVQGVKVENVDLNEDKNCYTTKPKKDNFSLHCVNEQTIDACDQKIKVDPDFLEEVDFKDYGEGRVCVDIKEEKREEVENEEHRIQIKSEVKDLDDSEVVEGRYINMYLTYRIEC